MYYDKDTKKSLGKISSSTWKDNIYYKYFKMLDV